MWEDLRRLEAERLKIGLPFNRESESSSILDPTKLRKEPHDSKALEAFEKFGAGAEYFRACWHDQNNPNPYFGCQNHMCVPQFDGDSISAAELGKHVDVSASGGDKKGKNAPAAVYGFQPETANRFSTAFSEANPSRRRAVSEATEIEDGDATPEIYVARVAPVVRAGPPIAAGSIAASVAAPVTASVSAPLVQSSNTRTPLPTAPVSVLPNSSVALPTAPKTATDPTPAVASTSTYITLQAYPPEHRPYEPPETAQNEPRTLPAWNPSKPDRSPDQLNAVNLSTRSYPKQEPSSFSDANPSIWKTGGSPQQKALGGEASGESGVTPAQNTYIVNHYYNQSGGSKRENVTLDEKRPPTESDHKIKTKWERYEKADNYQSREGKARDSGKRRGCFKRNKGPMTKKKKRLLWGIAASLVLIIILILVLVMTLTRKGDDLKVPSQWLNITGFPPVPTGISTIIQPAVVREDSGCIQPATVWSCAVPKEEQDSIAPNNPNQPNFRVEIRFRNGTSTNSSTLASAAIQEKRSLSRGPRPVSAGSFVRRRYLHTRDSLPDSLFSPSPAPPTQEDQAFLGKTTDNNTAPFDGEATPFFMSFVPASKLPVQRLMKRQKKQGKNSTDEFPDITKTIPFPETNADGTAAAANLLPFPVAQPLRLYNRGLATEHYGFYTYFDRSIFLKSTALLDETGPTVGEVPADRTGGADKSAATVRCTWRQTRFLVQIWTNSGAAAPLLRPSNATSTNGKAKDDPKNLTASSANEFIQPGSFPYPVSITLDRHGGALDKKFIFCYGLDKRGRVLKDKRKIQLEDRAFGGKLVNPALGPFQSVRVGKKEGGPGGIDGGSGGCGCEWRNWGGPFEAAGALR